MLDTEARSSREKCLQFLVLALLLFVACRPSNTDYRFVTPGFVPNVALGLTFPLSVFLFATMPPQRASLILILGGALFLPERVDFDLPLLPPLTKHSIPPLCVMVMCFVYLPKRMQRARLGRGVDGLIVFLVLSSFGTSCNNTETLVNGPIIRPGLTLFDGLSLGIRELLVVGLPFMIGRILFSTPQDLRLFSKYLLGFGLAYSLLMLFEVRMSPQLHNWIYGYHAHDFSQTIRWGGYRPTVFMEHGLAVGTFALAVSVFAISAWRSGSNLFLVPNVVLVPYLLIVLVLVKSTGALAIAVVLVPIVLLFKPRMQVRLAGVITLLIVLYPITKILDVFPGDDMVAISKDFNAERGQSLADRFYNDDMLIKRAQEKMLFGWGTYGRHRVFDALGRDLSVTDGYWIIQMGTRGVSGLIGVFGLLIVPTLMARKKIHRIQSKKDRMLLSGLSVSLLAFSIDLLPNGLYNSIPFLMSGAILGLSKGLLQSQAHAQAAPVLN